VTDQHPHHGPRSTPALISYALVAIWTLTVGGVFALIALRVPVADVMVGILGGVLSSTSAGLTAVAAFWLAGAMTGPRKDPTKPEDPKP